MKYVLVIPDGMGDNPVKKLGGRTPLEAARTPNMDFLASRGTVGVCQNIPKGFTPGTDIGCMSVFGYDPSKFYTGRGPLEAAELGIRLKKNDLAFRCNLVTVKGGLLKDFCAGHISTHEAAALLGFLNRHLTASERRRVRFYPGDGTGYRNLMVYRGNGNGPAKAHCVPPHDIMGRSFRKFLPKGKGAGFLTELMIRSLGLFPEHPVNLKRARRKMGEASMIWLWGQGSTPSFPSYKKKFGLRGGVITAVDLVKGMALHAGLDVIRVPGVTGYFDTNYRGKAEYALRALKKRDLVVIHVESTDEAGHMGDAKLKVKAIEDVDKLVLGTLRKGLKKFGAHKIMVMPDHFTCVETRTHSSAPVPFFIYSNRNEKKGPEKFCEKTAQASGISVKQGHRMMDLFLKGVSLRGGRRRRPTKQSPRRLLRPPRRARNDTATHG
ncbi:MAG: cofactor-independent phosphoglycerate mutase [Candidatus Omnitrophota bacterium]